MKTKLKKQIFLKKFFDKKVLNLISKQKKKIGFFVPLTGLYNSNKKKFNKYINISLKFLKIEGFHIDKKILMNNEIKWVLLNIGIFLKQNK